MHGVDDLGALVRKHAQLLLEGHRSDLAQGGEVAVPSARHADGQIQVTHLEGLVDVYDSVVTGQHLMPARVVPGDPTNPVDGITMSWNCWDMHGIPQEPSLYDEQSLQRHWLAVAAILSILREKEKDQGLHNPHGTMRFENTTKVLAKRMLMYGRISWCPGAW